MSFVDKVNVTVQAGAGGNGKLSFRHEKFIDKGGPDGGDGGHGGDVILQASRNQNTLAAFRFQKEIKAEDGQAGLTKALTSHPDLIVTDLRMPIMDGIEMIEKLRQDNWGKQDIGVCSLASNELFLKNHLINSCK